MRESTFRFKQFTLSQAQSAMKVSTDACLLGAWAPFSEGANSVLDIGCGTGLLSLMVAQRFPQAQITALELDPGAAGEAAENAAASLWTARIKVVQDNILTHDFEGRKFAGIICNPPFFQKSLGAQVARRHTARHDDSLPLSLLFQKVQELLPAGGQLALLLPPQTQAVWEALAAGKNLVQTQKVGVQPLPHKAPNRVLSLWKKGGFCTQPQMKNITIYEVYGQYTEAAKALLAPFLLKL